MRRIDKRAWLLAIASGLLQTAVFPSINFYFLCWFAVTPLMIAVLRARSSETLHFPDSFGGAYVPASAWQGFLLGWVSGLIWTIGTCYWIYHVMHVYGGLNALVSAGIMVLFMMYVAIRFGIFTLLLALVAGSHRGGTRRALLVSPLLWVTMELIWGLTISFQWLPLGTAQVDNIPLTRIATFTGVYGISAEIMLVNAAFAAAFLVTSERRSTLLVTTAAAALILQAGILVKPPALKADHAATLVQENLPITPEGNPWTIEHFQTTLQALSQLSFPPPGTKPGSEPGLIVWPESPAPFYVNDPFFRQAISNLAAQTHSYVIAGSLGVRNSADRQNPPELLNSAALIAPDGEWKERYDKIHLVPFGEFVPFKSLFFFAKDLTREVGEFSRGSDRHVFQLGSYTAGAFICYEAIFPDEVRQFASNGAGLLVNISNDGWFGNYGAPGQHLNMARMRAIENHRWLLRDTNSGITASIDPYGRIVARAPRNVRTALIGPFAIERETTFYTRHGDWFSWLCAIISVLAIGLRYRVRAGTVQSLW